MIAEFDKNKEPHILYESNSKTAKDCSAKWFQKVPSKSDLLMKDQSTTSLFDGRRVSVREITQASTDVGINEIKKK